MPPAIGIAMAARLDTSNALLGSYPHLFTSLLFTSLTDSHCSGPGCLDTGESVSNVLFTLIGKQND